MYPYQEHSEVKYIDTDFVGPKKCNKRFVSFNAVNWAIFREPMEKRGRLECLKVMGIF